MDAHEVDSPPCVHCGLCLEACPTYRLTGIEAESPRGRLYLMGAIRSGRASLDAGSTRHLESCLGCLACESACPSGVVYGRHIEQFRPLLREAPSSASARVTRDVSYRALRSERFQRLAIWLSTALDRLGLERARRKIPGIALMPRRRRGTRPAFPSATARNARASNVRVALLTGCGARVLQPELETAVLETLAVNGVHVERFEAGACCGALALHEGRTEEAHRLAAETLQRARALGADYVVTAAAGCRAALGVAASGSVHGEAQRIVARGDTVRVREICELLVELDFRKPVARLSGATETIAYHDACHLLHGARVTVPPRAVLEATGASVVDLGENAICCGSAGTYNLLHRRTAMALGLAKADLAVAGAIRRIAVANLGCVLQIELALARRGVTDVRVAHPVVYLAAAYRAEQPR